MMNYTTMWKTAPNGEKRYLTLPVWPDDIFAYDPMKDHAELVALYQEGRVLIDRLASEMPTTWGALTDELSEFFEHVHRLASPFGNLATAMQTQSVLDAKEHFTKTSLEFSNFWNFHEGLYRAFVAYRDGRDYGTLDTERKRYIDRNILEWELAGVQLPSEKRARLEAIHLELGKLSDDFSENVMNAQKSWVHHITDREQLRGIPEGVQATMREEADARGLSGWVAMIKSGIAIPILENAEDRELRRLVFEARVSQASDSGPDAGKFDNRPLAVAALRLRQELATILGKRNYGDVSVATKMASSPEEVFTFLREIGTKAKPIAIQENEELIDFARDELKLETFELWDHLFAMEKLREKRYQFSHEELRPYLSATKALEGVFAVAKRLYGWTFVETEASTWHSSVKFFEQYDEHGVLSGGIYVDLYARVGDKIGKDGGAWADAAMYRRVLSDGVQVPVAYLHLNCAPPEDGKDGRITHDDLVTIYHEFGHDGHHLAGLASMQDTSWGGVEWDTIELPSQRNEVYAWVPEVLVASSAHEVTGEALPKELVDKLLASRYFFEALGIIRQLEYSMIDMTLHTPLGAIDDTFIDVSVAQARSEVRIAPVHPMDRFPNSFTHIFSGGYAAGYPSYFWAEVLAADTNDAFLETGDIFNKDVASRYLHEVLEASGKRSMRESYLAFRGSMPKVEALLRGRGLPT